MGQRAIHSDRLATASPPSRSGTSTEIKRLVTVTLDDSLSTLDAEVALIDRLFGGDIAALFGEANRDDVQR
jgi:hypothetical protein